VPRRVPNTGPATQTGPGAETLALIHGADRTRATVDRQLPSRQDWPYGWNRSAI
jgi:hypothetical protein